MSAAGLLRRLPRRTPVSLFSRKITISSGLPKQQVFVTKNVIRDDPAKTENRREYLQSLKLYGVYPTMDNASYEPGQPFAADHMPIAQFKEKYSWIQPGEKFMLQNVTLSGVSVASAAAHVLYIAKLNTIARTRELC